MKATWQKWTACLLTATFILSTALTGPGVTASAAVEEAGSQAVTMTLTAPETAAPGGSFDVAHTMSGLGELDKPIYVMQMDLTYPEGLTCAEIVPAANINGTLTTGIHNDQNKAIVVYDSETLDGLPSDASGLFTARFEADEALEEGDYTIEMDNVMIFSADFDEIGSVLQNAAVHVREQAAPEMADLTVTFNAPAAQLWIGGEEQRLANLIGNYTQEDVPNGTELALDFVPTTEGRIFRAVTVNGGEPQIIGGDSYTYEAKMDTLNPNVGFVFETVNKMTLETMIDYAQSRIDAGDLDKVVPTVKKKFQAAFDAAEKVYGSEAATQKEIDQAWGDLLDMIHMLSFEAGVKTDLEDLIDTALTLDENDYISTAWSAFETALEEAQDVAADEDALKVDVDKAYESLYDAMIALLDSSKADRTMLDAAIAQAEGINLDEYLDAGKDAFTKAFEDAKALDADATQKEIDAATEALVEAMSALRKIPTREELEEQLLRMENKNLSGYTSSSISIYEAAKANLAAVMAKSNASPEELVAVYDAALTAEEKLTRKTNSSSKGSSGGSGKSGGTYGGTGTAVVTPVVSAAQSVAVQAAVRSDTTLPFTLARGSAYCFKMTVLNGGNDAPAFTVGDGNVLKTQFVAKIGNDYYFRVFATGKPGQSTGVYTTLPGQNPVKHCVVTVG